MTNLEIGLKYFKIDYNEDSINMLRKYYDILIEWNSFMNLTGIIDYEEVVSKHFIDSLSIVKVLPEILNGKDYKIIDMGSGAGFPGIPLKIMFPNIDILLLDSLNKRVKFLNHVISELKLNKIMAIHSRAEELAHKDDYRENFDICVSRAVAKMSVLLEYCLPFVKVGGYFIPYKSGKAEDEIIESMKAISVLGGSLVHTEKFILPNTEIERELILINKVKNISMNYPRLGGKPVKEPIQ